MSLPFFIFKVKLSLQDYCSEQLVSTMSTTTLGLYPYLVRFLTPLIKLYFKKRAQKEPEYALHWDERFAAVYSQISQNYLKEFQTTGTIHIHCASLGEVEMVKPLLLTLLEQAKNSKLKEQFTNCKFILTVFTPTGRAAGLKISQKYPELLNVVYAPLDFQDTCQQFVNTFKPKISIFTETELWPVFLTSLKNNGIKLFLINARINSQSIKRYIPNYKAVTKALQCFEAIGCQSIEQLNNFLQINSNDNLELDQVLIQLKDQNTQTSLFNKNYPNYVFNNCRYAICGNLKFNKNINTQHTPFHHLIQTQNQERACVLLSSTYLNESEIILHALVGLHLNKSQLPNLILARRKTEKFDTILARYAQLGYKLVNFSNCVDNFYQHYNNYIVQLQKLVNQYLNNDNISLKEVYIQAQTSFQKMLETVEFNSQHPVILLVDTFGHLNDLYFLGTANIVGGTFNLIGGHDPIFPLAFLMPVACGGNYSKQRYVVEDLKQAHAIWSCGNAFKKWFNPTKQELDLQSKQVQEFIKIHLEERIIYQELIKNEFIKLSHQEFTQDVTVQSLINKLENLSSSFKLQNNAHRAYKYFCANQHALSNYLDFLNLSND